MKITLKASIKAITCLSILLLGSIPSTNIVNAETSICRKFIGTWTVVDPPNYEYSVFFHFYMNGDFRAYALDNLEGFCLLGTWSIKDNQVDIHLSYPTEKNIIFTFIFSNVKTIELTYNSTRITLTLIDRNPNGFIICLQEKQTIQIPETLKLLSLKKIDESGTVIITIGFKKIQLYPGESKKINGINVTVVGSLYSGKIALFKIQHLICRKMFNRFELSVGTNNTEYRVFQSNNLLK